MPQLGPDHMKEAKKRAKRLGVEVEYSTRKYKKLDVFKKGDKIASIGDVRYSDYLQHQDKDRRRLYKIRHENDRHVKGSPGFYADKILW
tara:strand:- start:261 stop:527 length:267 start_codon:yes stop_codon:yes gene_type:complete